MAAKQNSQKLVGLVLLVAGAGLAFWGYQMSGAFGSQFSSAFSGSPSDGVMWRYIAGGVSAAVGLFLVAKS
jgi:hypothetical protein